MSDKAEQQPTSLVSTTAERPMPRQKVRHISRSRQIAALRSFSTKMCASKTAGVGCGKLKVQSKARENWPPASYFLIKIGLVYNHTDCRLEPLDSLVVQQGKVDASLTLIPSEDIWESETTSSV